MFVIALRLVGSGVPASAFGSAILVTNTAFQLDIRNDDRWTLVGKGEGHGLIYDSLNDAQDDYEAVADGLLTKKDFVSPVIDVISNFVEQYRHLNAAHQVILEIQFLNPMTIDEQVVDLGMF